MNEWRRPSILANKKTTQNSSFGMFAYDVHGIARSHRVRTEFFQYIQIAFVFSNASNKRSAGSLGSPHSQGTSASTVSVRISLTWAQLVKFPFSMMGTRKHNYQVSTIYRDGRNETRLHQRQFGMQSISCSALVCVYGMWKRNDEEMVKSYHYSLFICVEWSGAVIHVITHATRKSMRALKCDAFM